LRNPIDSDIRWSMLATSDIEQMSFSERLRTMELLWSSITPSDKSLNSPGWHKDILSARRAKVDNGDGHFMTISDLRKRLNPTIS